MGALRAIVIVGSSAAGKTTLVGGLRRDDGVVIPRRFVTRPPRPDDAESMSISRPHFEHLVGAGRIHPHWTRSFADGREERYGFAADDPADLRLRIYAANNAFLRDRNPSVERVLETALVVVVNAAEPTLDTRLAAKAMSPNERVHRLADTGRDVLCQPHVRVVDTTHLTPEQGQDALRRIVKSVLSKRYSISTAPRHSSR